MVQFKKVGFVFLLFLITVSLYAVCSVGDLDRDNSVTVIDALIAARFYVGLEVPPFDRYKGDVNGDNQINVVDALIINQFYIGLLETFPVFETVKISGDVNADGRIDIVDALMTAQFYVGLDQPCFNYRAADVDGDGQVTIIDSLLIARYYVGELELFPISGTGEGYDGGLPANLADLQNLLELRDSAVSFMEEQGFVVLGSSSLSDYLIEAYAKLSNQNKVSPYITADAVMHIFHMIFADMLSKTEENNLLIRLRGLLASLYTGALTEYNLHSGGADPVFEGAARKVLVFIAVANTLAQLPEDVSETGYPDIDSEVALLVENVYAHTLVEDWPGGEDYTQYKVKGHYTSTTELEHYYLSMKWLQRREFRFVREYDSFGEDVDLVGAAILSRLLYKTPTLQTEWAKIDGFTRGVTGAIALLSPSLLDGAIRSVFPAYGVSGYEVLREDISRDLLREDLNSRYDLKESLFTFMCRPFIMAEDAIRAFTDPVVANRYLPHGFDVGSAVLRAPAALELQSQERVLYSDLHYKLDSVTDSYTLMAPEEWQSSLYGSWYYTLRALSGNPVADGGGVEGYVPVYMQGSVWEKKMLNSQLSSWVELQSDYLNIDSLIQHTDPPTPTPTPVPTPVITPVATPSATTPPPPTTTPSIGGVGSVFFSREKLTVGIDTAFTTEVIVNSGNQRVAAYGFCIYYDPAYIKLDFSVNYTGVTAGSDGFISAVNPNTPGELVISGFDITGKGPDNYMNFLMVHWIALEEGLSTLSLDVRALTDDHYGIIGHPSGGSCEVNIMTGIVPTPVVTPPFSTPPVTPSPTPTPTPTPTPSPIPGFVEPYPLFFMRLSAMCGQANSLMESVDSYLIHKNKLNTFKGWVDKFAVMAQKVRDGVSFSDAENIFLLNWGKQLDSFFKVAGFFSETDAKTSVISDVYTHETNVFHVAVGKLHPVILIFKRPGEAPLGALGYNLIYYEFVRENLARINDEEWEIMLNGGFRDQQTWKDDFMVFW